MLVNDLNSNAVMIHLQKSSQKWVENTHKIQGLQLNKEQICVTYLYRYLYTLPVQVSVYLPVQVSVYLPVQVSVYLTCAGICLRTMPSFAEWSSMSCVTSSSTVATLPPGLSYRYQPLPVTFQSLMLKFENSADILGMTTKIFLHMLFLDLACLGSRPLYIYIYIYKI